MRGFWSSCGYWNSGASGSQFKDKVAGRGVDAQPQRGHGFVFGVAGVQVPGRARSLAAGAGVADAHAAAGGRLQTFGLQRRQQRLAARQRQRATACGQGHLHGAAVFDRAVRSRGGVNASAWKACACDATSTRAASTKPPGPQARHVRAARSGTRCRQMRVADAALAFVFCRRGVARQQEADAESRRASWPGRAVRRRSRARRGVRAQYIRVSGVGMPRAASSRVIAISGVMPLPAARNNQGWSAASGRTMSPKAGAEIEHIADLGCAAQVLAELAARDRLHGDRDAAIGAVRVAQAVAARDPRAVDLGADIEVLAGLEAAPVAVGLQHQGDGIARFAPTAPRFAPAGDSRTRSD